MSLNFQILSGGGLLVLCSAIQIVFILWTVHILSGTQNDKKLRQSNWHLGMLIAISFALIVFAHTLQVIMWAAAFLILEALQNVNDALYFALVTYTTLGYGDVTVGADFRIFAAMAAMTGVLNFGLSTAFLVGLLTTLMKRRFD